MTQNILLTLMILASFMFLQMIHPLAMGMILLLQTILISIYSGTLTDSFWFSYILFLTFLGGMLILFIYVTSLASNDTFSISPTLLLITPLILILMFLCHYFYDPLVTNSFNEYNFFSFSENYSNLIKMFNFTNNLITITLMNYLLVTLIAVVKITNINNGPLRQMI